MDAAAPVDAHDAPTRACKTARRAVSHKRPQPIIFMLIKNPDEPETEPTDDTRQTSSLSRECRQEAILTRSDACLPSIDEVHAAPDTRDAGNHDQRHCQVVRPRPGTRPNKTAGTPLC